MAKSQLENVDAHWCTLFEDFETSPQDYYAGVEKALEQRQVPDFKTTRLNFAESGMFGAKREYLRISRERVQFDICAAPFGKGFFFSWWQTRKAPSAVLFYLLLVAGVTTLLTVLATRFLPLPMGVWELAVTAPLALLVTLWLGMVASRLGWHGPEDAVMAVPLLDAFYESAFAPPTYHRLDSTAAFRAAVDAAVQEVITGLRTQKGLRALSDAERKPILRELLRG